MPMPKRPDVPGGLLNLDADSTGVGTTPAPIGHIKPSEAVSIMIATISPSQMQEKESVNTLRYAQYLCTSSSSSSSSSGTRSTGSNRKGGMSIAQMKINKKKEMLLNSSGI